MSHPESSNQEVESSNSGVMELVRTIDPTDNETTERLRVILPDSEIMQRLLNPEVNTVYTKNKLVVIDSPETRFFGEWAQRPHGIITEKEVRIFTQRWYARHAYHEDWFPRVALGQVPDYALCQDPPPRQFLTEGLGALAQLFADETYDTIKFQRVEDFSDVLNEYPPNTFKFGATACSYRDWRQGSVLALVRFGAIKTDHPEAKQMLSDYSSDLDFLERFTKEMRHGARPMLTTFRQFAKAWDVFAIPLRYFTCEAALGFARDQYGYTSKDIKRFRTIFLNGGNKKQGRGLKLTRATPEIVDIWNENSVRIRVSAAVHHGYNIGLLKQVLGERYKRKISVRP